MDHVQGENTTLKLNFLVQNKNAMQCILSNVNELGSHSSHSCSFFGLYRSQ